MVHRSHFLYVLPFLLVLLICLPGLASPVRQVRAASSPDLTVDSIWLEESSNPGQPVTQVNPSDQFLIVASIRNLGTATASGYYLDVYYDSDYGRGGPDTIAPGETQVWYVGSLTAQVGTHTTKWVVDPDNQIVELDESNNEKDYTFTIGAQTATTTSTSNSTTVLTTQPTQTSTNTTTTTSTSTTTTTSSTSTTLSPATVSITLTANPLGSIVVDGTTYTSQQTLTWVPGSSHTITANSPVLGDSGTQYVWTSWDDGGDQSRTITAPSSPTAYTANYQTQYQVTYSQTGCSLPVSMPTTEWVNAGVSAVGVFPSTVTSSDGKTQCLLQNASPPGPINAPTALTASWKTQWQVAFAVNPSGDGSIAVNGQPSATAWYDDGAVINVQASHNTGYAFSSWSGDVASITFANSSSSSTTVTIHGTGTITAKFNLQDTTPPVLTLPASVIVNATGPGGAVVKYIVSASDDADGPVTPVCVPSSGSTFALGSTKVSCSAIDKAGNAANGTFTVTVQDKAPPVLTVPADMSVEATSSKGAAVTFTASAVDLVDGSVTVTCTPASGSTFPLGTTTVSCSAKDKAGNSASGSFKVTVPTVTVTLLASNGSGLSGAVVQYYSGGWKAFGTTDSDGTAKMALASGTYNFQISWAGATQQKSQNVGTNSNVVFQTTLVTVKLLSSTNTELSGTGQYYAGGWKAFGSGTTSTSMELLPLTYTFQISYAGASQQKSQDVSKDPNVKFQTVLVTMKLLSSAGKELNGGAQYYGGGWKTFGSGTTTASMELLPLTYTFQISWAGASQQMSQNVATSPGIVFKTVLVTVKIQSSTNTELSGTAQYYAGGWKIFGSGTTTSSMELLPLTYTFQVSYVGSSQQVSQNAATNVNVVFQTVQVQSDSGKCTSYNAGGWKTFTQNMELLPGTYTFHFNDGTKDTSYTLVVGAVKHIH